MEQFFSYNKNVRGKGLLAWAQLLTNASLDPSSYHHSLLLPQHVHIFYYTPDITSMFVAGGGRGSGRNSQRISAYVSLSRTVQYDQSKEDWGHEHLTIPRGRYRAFLNKIRVLSAGKKKRIGLDWKLGVSGELR